MKRIIWGAFCAVVFIALACAVGIQWHKQGCEEVWQLVAMCMFYGSATAAIWKTIDATMKGE